MALESELIPYSSCLCINAQAALVLAPHPDDEIFGCGGAIVSHIEAGQPVCVVVLTDGGLFGDAKVRESESQAAAAVLGYGAPEFWSFPDGKLTYSEALVQAVVDKILLTKSDLVYAPSPWEIHPDHRQTTMVAVEAVRRIGQNTRLAFYEIGAPLRPNLLLDITLQRSVKDAAMRCFTSQLAQQDYVQHVESLNRYRTYTLPQTVKAAEAYWVLGALELTHLYPIETQLPVYPGVRQELTNAAQPGQTRPLVSILIRSLNRPYLAQALDSIALQTYPHIEVVVVAAVPDHERLPLTCGAFPLRLIKTDFQLRRSKAANVAIAAATGEFLLLLDDDDWLMPAHIARLICVLQRQPHALAAYTGIALVDLEGKTMGQVIDLPFDPVRQTAGNLTPIHAVMFRAAVQRQGCFFNENLELYEDWDFWLQLGKLAPMVHLPGVSAVYRIHGSSGVHASDNTTHAASLAIQKKWASEWTSDQLGLIMARVWSYPEVLTHLNDSRQAVEDNRRSLLHSEDMLSSMQARLVDTERVLSNTQHRLSDAERVLLDAQHRLSDTERVLYNTQYSLSGVERALSDTQHSLSQTERSLSNTQQSVSDALENLSTVTHLLEASGQQVMTLNQEVATRQAWITQRDETATVQQAQIEAIQKYAAEVTLNLARQQQDNAVLRQEMGEEITQLKRDRSALTSSRSWRITKPVRWAGGWARRVLKR